MVLLLLSPTQLDPSKITNIPTRLVIDRQTGRLSEESKTSVSSQFDN